MLESLRNKKIMIVVHVVILGEGITSRSDVRDVDVWKNELNTHRQNIKNAQFVIGYHSISIHNFPDNRFDSVALLDIVKVVENEKKAFNPEIIFTHHGGDLNIDHRRTFESVITACRPMKDEQVKIIITFETPSGTEWRSPSDPHHFLPNLFISVTQSDIDAKIKGMESYEFECRKYPHPRSPEAIKIQAQRWGTVVGTNFAEAFCLIRSIT